MSIAASRRIRRRERAALRYWIAHRAARAELQLVATGGFRGRVRRAQRPWSWLLDVLEARRQAICEAAA